MALPLLSQTSLIEFQLVLKKKIVDALLLAQRSKPDAVEAMSKLLYERAHALVARHRHPPGVIPTQSGGVLLISLNQRSHRRQGRVHLPEPWKQP